MTLRGAKDRLMAGFAIRFGVSVLDERELTFDDQEAGVGFHTVGVCEVKSLSQVEVGRWMRQTAIDGDVVAVDIIPAVVFRVEPSCDARDASGVAGEQYAVESLL